MPARLSREALRDGYVRLMEDLYHPDAYFERLAGGLGNGSVPFAPARARYWRSHPVARLKRQALNLARAAALYARLMGDIEDADLRKRYRREVRRQFLSHRDPAHVLGYLIRCALHYHHYTFAQQMARHHSPVLNSF